MERSKKIELLQKLSNNRISKEEFIKEMPPEKKPLIKIPRKALEVYEKNPHYLDREYKEKTKDEEYRKFRKILVDCIQMRAGDHCTSILRDDDDEVCITCKENQKNRLTEELFGYRE